MELAPRDVLALGAFVSGLTVEALPNVKFVLAVVATVSVGRHCKCCSGLAVEAANC